MAENKEYIEKTEVLKNKVYIHGYYFVSVDVIKELPVADVVEVVRCKDCKHSTIPSSFHNKELWCGNNRYGVNKLDFCSYGEKAGAGNG